jgi:hypothetical protein
MPTETIGQRSSSISWQNVMIALGLSAALIIVAALFGSFAPYPALIVVLAAAAFVGAGFLTLRIRSAAKPVEAAIGSGLLILLLSLAQTLARGPMMPRLSATEMIVSVVVSLAFACALAWLGARLAIRGGMSHRHDIPSSV